MSATRFATDMQRRPRTNAPARVHPPSVVSDGAQLGEDVVVGAFCFVASGAVVGRGSRIQSHTCIWDGVVLGQDVFVGPGAHFTNVRRPRAAFPRAPKLQPTFVEDGATVGANATLVAPVRVGRCAVVSAGAVVTRDVPDHAVVAGNPALVIGCACEWGESLALTEVPPPIPIRCARCATSS